MIKYLRKFLYDPDTFDVDVNSKALFSAHKNILLRKKLLRSAFITFYEEMANLSDRFFKPNGMEIELGSGVGFFKTLRKNLKTSDIRKGSDNDFEIDAQKMNLRKNSVRCFYAINVFHHLPDPVLFLNEICRVLKVGGGVILIEPHNGFASSLLHKHLHKDEEFKPDAKSWENKFISGPLSGANQALAYIVFERDLDLFNQLFGKKLEIVYQGYIPNSLRYFFSGGLNFRQLAPSCFEKFFILVEFLLKPLSKHLAFHQVIVLRKK
jgi:SAM-dependent methyltransferase